MGEEFDSAAKRAYGFREVLKAMLAGGGGKEAIAPWQAILDDTKPEDLVNVVDAAAGEGIDFAILKPAVSRLINLMHTSLSRHRYEPQKSDLFFASLLAENRGLLELLDDGKAGTKALNNSESGAADAGLARLARFASRLSDIEIHFRKKENVLFPWFEARYPQFRCVRLMWDIHDDARRELKDLASLLDQARSMAADAEVTVSIETRTANTRSINALIGKLYFDLNTNIFREECAFFPVMAPLLSEADSLALFAEAHEFGYAFLSDEEKAGFTKAFRATPAFPGPAASPGPERGEFAVSPGRAFMPGGFTGRTGSLPPEVLGALFSTIHLDLTWVDSEDKVRWFSDSPRRIFPRSPAIIGRDVRNCHPGTSVGKVVAILEDFRTGKKDHETFWLNMRGRFLHIEYFALRGSDGSYLGTLEASEDLTEKRGLEGEKRLADPL